MINYLESLVYYINEVQLHVLVDLMALMTKFLVDVLIDLVQKIDYYWLLILHSLFDLLMENGVQVIFYLLDDLQVNRFELELVLVQILHLFIYNERPVAKIKGMIDV